MTRVTVTASPSVPPMALPAPAASTCPFGPTVTLPPPPRYTAASAPAPPLTSPSMYTSAGPPTARMASPEPPAPARTEPPFSTRTPPPPERRIAASVPPVTVPRTVTSWLRRATADPPSPCIAATNSSGFSPGANPGVYFRATIRPVPAFATWTPTAPPVTLAPSSTVTLMAPLPSAAVA